METKAFCACVSVVIRFCICQKPRKLYLCNSYTNTHISKPCANAFCDAKVNDLLDLDLHNISAWNASQLRW